MGYRVRVLWMNNSLSEGFPNLNIESGNIASSTNWSPPIWYVSSLFRGGPRQLTALHCTHIYVYLYGFSPHMDRTWKQREEANMHGVWQLWFYKHEHTHTHTHRCITHCYIIAALIIGAVVHTTPCCCPVFVYTGISRGGEDKGYVYGIGARWGRNRTSNQCALANWWSTFLSVGSDHDRSTELWFLNAPINWAVRSCTRYFYFKIYRP